MCFVLLEISGDRTGACEITLVMLEISGDRTGACEMGSVMLEISGDRTGACVLTSVMLEISGGLNSARAVNQTLKLAVIQCNVTVLDRAAMLHARQST